MIATVSEVQQQIKLLVSDVTATLIALTHNQLFTCFWGGVNKRGHDNG